MRAGYPVFTVGGKPFFMWGSAFFYERLPRERWRKALEALRAMHVNTLDLYIPWNWHELADGDFDFEGRTSSRRDLRGLVRLASSMGFYFVVRPGPVIRNEWRNAGYPAWLLQRPEYRMPLHDILEGRYPATATLQNARSDDAAAEWMRNPVHRRYARRWLQRSLAEFAPVAPRVLAIALDDDQGAYLTNQTWPAPHLRAYLTWLAAIVGSATSPRVPVFINTYQMKVTASSPVWAMGNWYQSDARAIGAHDRAQLAFSTALLGTRPHQPIFLSEFQAGWLQAPENIYPRPADPSNTLLALHTALADGARGVIDFPMQDTLAPPGWEAPFANWFYAWDAALGFDGRPAPRFAPTTAFGAMVARDGAALAQTHPVADAAIVWWTSALDPKTLGDEDVGTIANATIEAQQMCRARELACALVDLRFADAATLARYPALIVPRLPSALRAGPRVVTSVRARLDEWTRRGKLAELGAARDPVLARVIAARTVRGMQGATLHAGMGIAFLDVVNYAGHPISGIATVRLDGAPRNVPVKLAARSATLIRLDRTETAAGGIPAGPEATAPPSALPLRRDVAFPLPFAGASTRDAIAFRRDVYRDGSSDVVLENSRVRIVIAPAAGGRAFAFEDLVHGTSAFTTVGALRDDVTIQPPPSKTDRIAKYTHTFAAGTFNRPYRISELGSNPARVTLTYDAPDVVPHGARFERTLILRKDSDKVDVEERFVPGAGGSDQRHVVISSLAIGATNGELWTGPVLLPDRARLAPDFKQALPLEGRSRCTIPEPANLQSHRGPWRGGSGRAAGLRPARRAQPHAETRNASDLFFVPVCGRRSRRPRKGRTVRRRTRSGRGSGGTVYAVASKATE